MDITYQAMIPLLQVFYAQTHSYGLSIILLTCAVRILVWPLVSKQTKSMQKMQLLQPKMKELQERLSEHSITVEMTEAARGWLAKEGYDPAFGARPLQRAIQKYVESPLSVELLEGKFKDDTIVQVDVDEKKNKLIFNTTKPASKAKQKQPVEV